MARRSAHFCASLHLTMVRLVATGKVCRWRGVADLAQARNALGWIVTIGKVGGGLILVAVGAFFLLALARGTPAPKPEMPLVAGGAVALGTLGVASGARKLLTRNPALELIVMHLAVIAKAAAAAMFAGLLVMKVGKQPITPLVAAGMVVLGIGVAVWEFRKELPRLRAQGARVTVRPGPVLAALALAALAALLLLWAPWAATPPRQFYYPVALSDSAILALLVIVSLAKAGVVGPRPIGDGSDQARYVALGFGMLAVVAFALWQAQKELAGVGSSLPQFFVALPAHWHALPPLALGGLATLALLAVMGTWRLAMGLRGPFLRPGLRGAGGDILWLLAAAALWIFGVFVPDSWGLFGPGPIRIANFGLEAFYLFDIVNSAVVILLLIGGGGGMGPQPVRDDIDRQKFRW